MRELKPYIGPHPTDHTLTEYYLKSEADKVIADKDAEILRMIKKIGDNKMNELKKPSVLQLRHNNREGFVYAYEVDEMNKYLSELDGMIAELKRQIEFLKTTHDSCGNCSKCAEGMGKVFDENLDKLKADYKEACDRLQTANLIKDEQLAATRHSKRKRCLNKAEWCEERCARYDLLQEHSGFSWRREIDFYFRWYQRWLELAEKFKDKEADK